MRRSLPLIAFAGVLLAACSGMRRDVPLEERFGVRPDSLDDGSERMDVTAPDSARDYFYAPAILETVVVRTGPFDVAADTSGGVPVEVLIKGALPDACSELHRVTQERVARLVDIQLTMRRPQGAVCATVVRPYRFYVLLDGLYEPGAYALQVNGTSKPFEVHAPRTDG